MIKNPGPGVEWWHVHIRLEIISFFKHFLGKNFFLHFMVGFYMFLFQFSLILLDFVPVIYISFPLRLLLISRRNKGKNLIYPLLKK